LKNIDLEISKKNNFGVLGPNAAGKTTLLKLMACVTMPTEGNVEIMGMNSKYDKKKIHQLLGYLSHELLLYRELTGFENLYFYSKFYPPPSIGWHRRINQLLKLLKIDNWSHEFIGNMSSGIQKRFDIARTFLHNPDLILLDEPFSNLDLESQKIVSKIIHGFRGEKTVIISTHNIDHAKRLCDEMAIFSKGKLIRKIDKGKLKSIRTLKLFGRMLQ
jgi:ABC-type multidrug transport system ATPase subunit